MVPGGHFWGWLGSSVRFLGISQTALCFGFVKRSAPANLVICGDTLISRGVWPSDEGCAG
jgi:hypothetical protein